MDIDQHTHSCPIASMLRLVSAKWTVEILREVSIRPVRTRQFLTHIPGLSMKCLQERLKALESLGMIERIKYDERVPRVEHHITERGMKLLEIFVALKQLACDSMGVCICPIELRYHKGENGDEASLVAEMDCPTRRESRRG